MIHAWLNYTSTYTPPVGDPTVQPSPEPQREAAEHGEHSLTVLEALFGTLIICGVIGLKAAH